MGAPRATALLVAWGLFGVWGASPGRALEASSDDAAQATAAAEPAQATAESAAEAPLSGALLLKGGAEAEPTGADAIIDEPSPNQLKASAADVPAALADIAPPDLPEVAVSIPTPDPIA